MSIKGNLNNSDGQTNIHKYKVTMHSLFNKIQKTDI